MSRAMLDAYAVIALLRGEPAGDDVLELLNEQAPVTPAVNAAEVIDKMTRVFGGDADDIEAELAMLGITILPVDPVQALDAGRVRARHYHHVSCAVSLADCVAAVTAGASGGPLVTADPHLADVCRRIGVPLVPLPDTRGVRPTGHQG